MFDFEIQDEGTIVLFRPKNREARVWFEDNVQPDATWFAGALVVEPRYAQELINGLESAGFDYCEYQTE